MLAVAELTFLRQFSFRGAPRCFTAGGPTGEIMKDLLTTEGIEIDPIPVKKLTRESFVAVDDNTNSQYRFSGRCH
jgi:fructose-1-phosphate kinase PfkB-like protein